MVVKFLYQKYHQLKLLDLAKAIGPNKKINISGVRPGEKMHEIMCPQESAHLTLNFKDHYVIYPSNPDKKTVYINNLIGEKGKKVKKDFEYSSDKNKDFLSVAEIKKLNDSL